MQRKLVYQCLHCRWVESVEVPFHQTCLQLLAVEVLPAHSDLSLPRFLGDFMRRALATSISPSRVLAFPTLVLHQLQLGGDTYRVWEAPWSWRQNHGQSRFASQGGIVSWFIMRHGLENTLNFVEKHSIREKRTLSGELGYRWSRLFLWVKEIWSRDWRFELCLPCLKTFTWSVAFNCQLAASAPRK